VPVSDNARLSAGRFTLSELLGLVLATAVAAHFAALGSPALGLCLLVFVVCTRLAIVDYSLLGALATSLVMLTGIVMIFLGTFWTLRL
jgi:hypothetical protein